MDYKPTVIVQAPVTEQPPPVIQPQRRGFVGALLAGVAWLCVGASGGLLLGGYLG